MSGPADLDPEDAKIITLARSSRARTGAAEGAAVRDTDGRTYVAATVTLPSLQLTALQAAVAAAVSSGAAGLEAAAVVTEADGVDGASLAAVRDLAPGATVLHADATGAVRAVLSNRSEDDPSAPHSDRSGHDAPDQGRGGRPAPGCDRSGHDASVPHSDRSGHDASAPHSVRGGRPAPDQGPGGHDAPDQAEAS